MRSCRGWDRMNMYRIAAVHDALLHAREHARPLHQWLRRTQRSLRTRLAQSRRAGHGGQLWRADPCTADGGRDLCRMGKRYGRLVKIKHEFGIETRYGHLSQIRVNVGDR